jgi:hypothetical protein
MMQTWRHACPILTNPGAPWRQFAILAIGSLLIAACAFSPLHQPGQSPDSLAYLKAAANQAAGSGLGNDYLYWPPLYPLLLTPFVGLHLGACFGVLNYVLLAGMAYCALTLFRSVGGGIPGAFAAAIALSFASPMQLIFRVIWSETLFLPLSLAWLLNWGRYLATGNRRDLTRSCICYGLCLLTRHAGMTIAIAMLVTLMFESRQRSWGGELGAPCAIALSTVPYLFWLGRCYLVSGTLTGPRPPPTQAPPGILFDFSATLSHWLVPGLYLHGFDPKAMFAAAAVLAVPCAASAYFHLHNRNSAIAANIADRIGERTSLTALIFVLSYLGFFLVASEKIHLDAIGDRFLAPIFAPLLALCIFAFARMCNSLESRHRYLRSMIVLGGIIWVLGVVLLP